MEKAFPHLALDGGICSVVEEDPCSLLVSKGGGAVESSASRLVLGIYLCSIRQELLSETQINNH